MARGGGRCWELFANFCGPEPNEPNRQRHESTKNRAGNLKIRVEIITGTTTISRRYKSTYVLIMIFMVFVNGTISARDHMQRKLR